MGFTAISKDGQKAEPALKPHEISNSAPSRAYHLILMVLVITKKMIGPYSIAMDGKDADVMSPFDS
jgi:hypothetical protein